MILRQSRVLLSTLAVQQLDELKLQEAESQTQIERLAIEIVATVPQLAGYHEQLEYRRLSERDLPLRSGTWPFKAESDEVPADASFSAPDSMEYTAFYGNEPSPSRKGEAPVVSRSQTSIKSDSEIREVSELQVDAPARIFPPVGAPQPASVYHLLFQLYSLRSVPVLPTPFKTWVRERIAWLESISNPEDLSRLQDMVAKSPSDGFPTGSEG